MGLSDFLARAASQRLHVLVVEGPDSFVVRAAAERACRTRGWPLAASPAEADLLLTCRPDTSPLAAACDAVFDQMPGPRARADVWTEQDLESVLDELSGAYLAWQPDASSPDTPEARHGSDGNEVKRPVSDSAPDHDHPTGAAVPHPASDETEDADETDRPGDADGAGQASGNGDSPAEEPKDAHHKHPDAPHEADEQLGDDTGKSHDTGDDRDMDDGQEMEMSGPGGIALASGAPDRDGLEMDRLHLRLGPVLSAWPAGLALWCTLAGDVLTDVEVDQPPFPPATADAAAPIARAVQLDAAARVLSLAGAGVLAADAWVVRDDLLAWRDREAVTDERDAALSRRVHRSRVLRWSLRGLGVVTGEALEEHGWPAGWAGDVRDRLLRLLDGDPGGPARLVGGAKLAAALPVLLPGMDLAAARLVVASLVGHVPARVVAPRRARR